MSNGRPAERNGVRSRQRLWWLHAYSAKVAANKDANRPTSKAPFILLVHSGCVCRSRLVLH